MISILSQLLVVFLSASQSLAQNSSTSQPWGPYTYTDTSIRVRQYFRYTTIPEVPVLDEAGLRIDFGTTRGCQFSMCLTYLIVAPDQSFDKWNDICEAVVRNWNASASSTEPRHSHLDDSESAVGADIDTVSTSFVQVRPGVHHVLLVSLNNRFCPFVFNFTGMGCTDGYFGKDCSTRAAANLPHTFTLDAGETAVLYARATSGFVATLTLEFQSEPSNVALELFARTSDVSFPALGVFDQRNQSLNGSGVLSVESPRYHNRLQHPQLLQTPSLPLQLQLRQSRPLSDLPTSAEDDSNYSFDYVFFSIHNPPATNQTVTVSELNITEMVCHEFRHGDNCQFLAAGLASAFSYPVLPRFTQDNFWTAYLELQLQTNRFGETMGSFSVGVVALNGDEPAPALYLRQGNIPSLQSYDMRVDSPVHGARFYSSGRTSLSSLWYIGVHVPNTPGGFGVWYNSDCPVDCSDHGKCANHVCVCDPDYSRFDCSTFTPSVSGLSSGELAVVIVFSALGLFLLTGAGYFIRVRSRKKGDAYEYLVDSTTRKPDYESSADKNKQKFTIGEL